MTTQSVQSNAHGQHGRGAGEGQVDDQPHGTDNGQRLSAKHVHGIGEVVNVSISAPEEEVEVRRVGGKDTDAQDGDEPGDQAQRLQHRRQTENADPDFGVDEDEAGLPSAQDAVLLSTSCGRMAEGTFARGIDLCELSVGDFDVRVVQVRLLHGGLACFLRGHVERLSDRHAVERERGDEV